MMFSSTLWTKTRQVFFSRKLVQSDVGWGSAFRAMAAESESHLKVRGSLQKLTRAVAKYVKDKGVHSQPWRIMRVLCLDNKDRDEMRKEVDFKHQALVSSAVANECSGVIVSVIP